MDFDMTRILWLKRVCVRLDVYIQFSSRFKISPTAAQHLFDHRRKAVRSFYFLIFNNSDMLIVIFFSFY